MSKCFFLIDQRTNRRLIGERIKLVADPHIYKTDMTMQSERRRLCGKFDDYKTIDRPIHIRANKSFHLTWICMQRSQLNYYRSHHRELVICKRVEMLLSDLFAQRSNARCSCWKTSNIFQSGEESNRYSCFFLLHLENRSTGHSHPARAKPFQPVYVYSG